MSEVTKLINLLSKIKKNQKNLEEIWKSRTGNPEIWVRESENPKIQDRKSGNSSQKIHKFSFENLEIRKFWIENHFLVAPVRILTDWTQKLGPFTELIYPRRGRIWPTRKLQKSVWNCPITPDPGSPYTIWAGRIILARNIWGNI